MSNFTPIGDKVILKEKAVDSVSGGGIILTQVKDAPTTGTVVAVNEETSKKYNIEVGDEVLFGRHSTVSVKINGNDLQIIELKNAFGIFKNV